jgi:hypothetical protein
MFPKLNKKGTKNISISPFKRGYELAELVILIP